MPHLLLIGPDWDVTSRFRSDLVADALARGWRVTVAAGGAPEDGAHVFEAMGAACRQAPIERNALNPLSDLNVPARLEALCRELKPDAVLAFTVKPVVYGLVSARKAGVPVRAALIAGLGYAFMEGAELKRRLVRLAATFLYRRALKSAQRAFFQNGDDRDDFLRLGILSPTTPVTIVPGSGVDLARFERAPLPDGPVTFVMISRLLREKGVGQFVDAARKLKQSSARFVLVGPLDTNPSSVTHAETEAWVREGVVEYVGAQADVRPFLRDAHVFVLPSFYREGVPRSALEALAMGRPVLTTDAPGCREAVIDGVTGRRIAPRDVEALADAMTWFIEHRDELPAMSKAARAEAENRFDVHGVNRTMLSALEDDLARAQRR